MIFSWKALTAVGVLMTTDLKARAYAQARSGTLRLAPVHFAHLLQLEQHFGADRMEAVEGERIHCAGGRVRSQQSGARQPPGRTRLVDDGGELLAHHAARELQERVWHHLRSARGRAWARQRCYGCRLVYLHEQGLAVRQQQRQQRADDRGLACAGGRVSGRSQPASATHRRP